MLSLISADAELLFAAAAIIAFAGLVHGTLGLGFPMVATPILAVFFDVRTAILLTLLPTVVVNVISIFSSSQRLDVLRKYAPLTAFSLIGALFGAWLLANFDPSPFRLALAGLIVLYLFSNVSGRLPGHWLNRYPFAAMAVFGLVGGVSAGSTNVMVAVLIIYFLSLRVPRDEMVPALNSSFLVGKLSQIVVLAYAGLVGVDLLLQTLPLAGVAALALLVGQRIREHIAVDTYRRVLQILLVVLATTLVVQFAVEVNVGGV